jgi:hypothetical protein
VQTRKNAEDLLDLKRRENIILEELRDLYSSTFKSQRSQPTGHLARKIFEFQWRNFWVKDYFKDRE